MGSGNVRQLGDEQNAFYAALGAPCGIAVLSGTGSFATGRDKAGRTATAGGWGPLFSDEGSGYHIGVLCLSRLALLHDTHVTGTLLEKNVLEMLGLPDVLSIRDAAYRPDFTRRHVARLSYAVERSAREGDANACAVLDEAACALARLAATVAGQLDADGLLWRSRAAWRAWESCSPDASAGRWNIWCPSAYTSRQSTARWWARRFVC